MIEVIGVRFKPVGKVYYFDPKGLSLKNGDKVIVETVRGLEIGDVVIENREVPEDDKFMPLSPVIRVATEQDLKVDEKNREKEKKLLKSARKKSKSTSWICR